ncbi:MAG: hypothetical protein PWP65_1633 [Clostridia bacterium]|nr:hypothetical protein [Clostridia bacterium]
MMLRLISKNRLWPSQVFIQTNKNQGIINGRVKSLPTIKVMLVFVAVLLLLLTVSLSGCNRGQAKVGENFETPVADQDKDRPSDKSTSGVPITTPSDSQGQKKSSSTSSKKDVESASNNERPQSPAPQPLDKTQVKRPVETKFYERQNYQGGVEIVAIWLTPEYMQARGLKLTPEQEQDMTKNLVFHLAFTTHSGDLTTFNVAAAAQLEINGRKVGPGTWEYVFRDSHHPEGLLRFPAPKSEPVKELRLTIANLRGIPLREFVWKL